jgi:hypothetical protein
MYIVKVSFYRDGVIYDQTLEVTQFIPLIGVGSANGVAIWRFIIAMVMVPPLDVLSISAISESFETHISFEPVATTRSRYQPAADYKGSKVQDTATPL